MVIFPTFFFLFINLYDKKREYNHFVKDNKLSLVVGTINCLDTLLLTTTTTCDIANQYNRVTFCDVFVAVSLVCLERWLCIWLHGVYRVCSGGCEKERSRAVVRRLAPCFCLFFYLLGRDIGIFLLKITFRVEKGCEMRDNGDDWSGFIHILIILTYFQD